MERKKGQVATEYLIVVAFATFLILSILGLSLFYSGQIQDRIKFNHLVNFGNKVVSSAETVFFAGEPSKVTIVAYLPTGVESVTIQDDALVFVIASLTGDNTISFSSDVPIAMDAVTPIRPSEGVKRLKIVAGADKVTIGEDLQNE